MLSRIQTIWLKKREREGKRKNTEKIFKKQHKNPKGKKQCSTTKTHTHTCIYTSTHTHTPPSQRQRLFYFIMNAERCSLDWLRIHSPLCTRAQAKFWEAETPFWHITLCFAKYISNLLLLLVSF